MSRFYARYVPPTKKDDAGAESTPPQKSNPDKRKREEDAPQSKNKKPKTSKVTLESTACAIGRANTDAPVAAGNVLTKYRVTESARSTGASVSMRVRQSKDTQPAEEDGSKNGAASKRGKTGGKQKNRKSELTEQSDLDNSTSNVQRSPESQRSPGDSLVDEGIRQHDKSRKKKKAQVQQEGGQQDEDADFAGYAQKHAGVLSKFEKAKQQDQEKPRPDGVSHQPPPELHGLEPIPQPALVDSIQEAPSYSVLPPWQENPIIVPHESNTEFSSFGLSELLVKNLRKRGLDRPLPVQETVLPLLLKGPGRHRGDMCVSAATGSGKTLSYVLPIIADLKERPGTKLRAVIIVPTRELVKQVHELCVTCSAGTSLKFATTVGSKSLSEEQEILVTEDKVYDPVGYQKWQQSPVDWSTFSLARLAERIRDEDPLDSIGHISQYRSKVDVLITTPGRLVDHLKSTPGFTLDHVAWLVVDEADRLLNESYQEWVAVVRPALESQAATQKRDDLLRHMRMTPPRRGVTKVLLSATMTRDLSKLNALGLYNPRLIVLGRQQEEKLKLAHSPRLEAQKGVDGNEAFHLPETLKETVIPIVDGSQKPLFLLKLVRDCIGVKDTLLKPVLVAAKSTTVTEVESDSTTETSSDSESDSEQASSSDGETSSSSNSLSDVDSMPVPKKIARGRPVETERSEKAPRVLIFTRSTASAERLSRLLCILDPELAPRIATLTRSTASSASSRRALASFRNFRVSVLIATDRASRGLDVPGLEHVVSYDVPNSALTYVHRVGRTARAGMGGQAWTLVEHREGAWFWREIGGKGKQLISKPAPSGVSINRKTKVLKLHLSLQHSELSQSYEAALKQLGEEALGGQ